jgi:Ca2+/Na+ antiporter
MFYSSAKIVIFLIYFIGFIINLFTESKRKVERSLYLDVIKPGIVILFFVNSGILSKIDIIFIAFLCVELIYIFFMHIKKRSLIISVKDEKGIPPRE